MKDKAYDSCSRLCKLLTTSRLILKQLDYWLFILDFYAW